MLRIVASCLFVILLFACQTSNSSDEQLELINGISFRLMEGEKVQTFSPEKTQRYLSWLQGLDAQVPLFRYIKGSGRQIYIGLPVGADFPQLLKGELQGEGMAMVERVEEIPASTSETLYDLYGAQRYESSNSRWNVYITSVNNTLLYVIVLTDKQQASLGDDWLAERLLKD